MPSTTDKQRRFFGYLKSHPEKAKERGVEMSTAQISDFAKRKPGRRKYYGEKDYERGMNG